MASFLENASRNLLREEGTKLSSERDEDGNPYHLTYLDSEGYLTFGHGHKVTEEDPEFGLGEGQLVHNDRVREMYNLDLQKAAGEAQNRVSNFDYLPDTHKSIVTQMAFQMGGVGLSGFENFLGELNSPQPDNSRLRDHLLDSKWAKYDSPARANRLADSLLKGEDPPLPQDFTTAVEQSRDRDFRRQDLANRFGPESVAQYPESNPFSQNRSAVSKALGFPDERELSAESEYLYSTKIAEILGDQPGFQNLSSADFLPGKFGGIDRTISAEENYQKNVLPKLGSFAFTYHPEGQDQAYVSSLMDGPMPGMIYMPGPFDVGVEAADIKSYSDLSPAIRKYQQERLALYNEDGESFTDNVRSYLDASVFAVANAANHTMKFSDYWASALPLAIISGWDYVTTSDEEKLEELIDKNPGLDEYLEKEREALKPGSTEEEKSDATIRGMQAYQAFIGSDKNQARLSQVYQKVANDWNIPFDKVPGLLGQMAIGNSPLMDRLTASAQVRLAAIEDEEYWAKEYYVIPSQLSVVEKRPEGVFSFPTTRAEVGLDLAIASTTYGLGKAGINVSSLLFNKFLGPKSAQAAKLFVGQRSKRIQLERVRKELFALGATHTLASRVRNFIGKKVAGKKSTVGTVDPSSGTFKEGFIGPLTSQQTKIKGLMAKADELAEALDADDKAIMKLTRRSSVPSVARYAKKDMKAFYPDAPFWMRLADEVAFTTAANSMLNNFVFDSSTGLKLATEEDIAESSALGRFLMAMTPLVGGVAVGSFKSFSEFDPTNIAAKEANQSIPEALLKTGERRKVEPVPAKLSEADDQALKEIGIENPFRELSHAPDKEWVPNAKATLFSRLVYPLKEFNPKDYQWGWENLREMLLNPERRQEISRTIELGRKNGVDEDFLAWFENGIDDVYKLWDDGLSKNKELQARRFLESDLGSEDFGWLENAHNIAVDVKNAGEGVDLTDGRIMDDQTSYVLHRDGQYAAVARARPDGKWDVEIVKTDKVLRGAQKKSVEGIYNLAARNLEQVFTQKKALFSPVQRIAALKTLSDQTASSLAELVPAIKGGEELTDNSFSALRQVFEGDFSRLAQELDVDDLLKRSNSDLYGYFRDNVEGFSVPLGMPQLNMVQTKPLIGQYLRTRLQLGNNTFFQANTKNLTQPQVNELQKILTRAAQRTANVASAPILADSPLAKGAYTVVDVLTGLDPSNLVSVRKGKPVSVDPVTYFREQITKNKRKYKTAATKENFGRTLQDEIVTKKTKLIKTVGRGGKVTWKPQKIAADPTTPRVTKFSPEARKILRNPELEKIEVDSPEIPNQVYIINLGGKMGPNFIEPWKDKFQVVYASADDAALGVWDLRSLTNIARADTVEGARRAFRDMLELQKSLNVVPPGSVYRFYESTLGEQLSSARTIEEVFDLYKNSWVGGSSRQVLGGPRSIFEADYLAQITWDRMRKFDVQGINSFGVDKRSINQNTLLARSVNTNKIRVYSGIARSTDSVQGLAFRELSGAGYPLGRQLNTDYQLRMQRKKYLDDFAERAKNDPIEKEWMGSFRFALDEATQTAVEAAKLAAKKGPRSGVEGSREGINILDGNDTALPEAASELIVRGSGINRATAAGKALIDSDDLFSLNVKDSLDASVSYEFLINLFGREGAKTAVDTVARLKGLKEGKSLAQRGFLEAASRIEAANRLLGTEGEAFSTVRFEKTGKGKAKEEVLKWVPGTDYTRKTPESRKTANVFFRAWGLNDRIKAEISRLREDLTQPEQWEELQELRDRQQSFVSRVAPWATQGTEFLKLEFERMQSFNGSELFLGTAAKGHKDALMSRVERFATLTPEEQVQKIHLSSKPDDYVTLKDIKLLLDVVDQNVLAPRRYRHERMNKNFQEAWLQNYYPRIWDIKASVDRWRKEGKDLEGKLPPGMGRPDNPLDPMDVDQQVFHQEFLKFVQEKYLEEVEKGGRVPKGNQNWTKERSAMEWLAKDEKIYRKDYFDELLQRGFVPATLNPVEMATLKANEMDNYVMGTRIVSELLSNNLIHKLDFDELLSISQEYKQLAAEKNFQGRAANLFHNNFVDVTKQIQQIAPGLFTKRQRAATQAAIRSITEEGGPQVLDKTYEGMTKPSQPLLQENVWFDPILDKTSGEELTPGFWAKVDPKGELDLTSGIPDELLGNEDLLNKVIAPVPARMFYADPHVAKIIQNVTSPGLPRNPKWKMTQPILGNEEWTGAALWDKWRRGNNFLNGINLGWSAFHASSVGLFENIMNDLTKFSRAVTMVKDLKRAEEITKFRDKNGMDKEIDKKWFWKNSLIRALTPGSSILIQAGQFPVRSRIPTLALPNLRTGRSTPTELLPSKMENYKSKTGLRLRERYEKRFTQKLGDSDEIVGKGFVQVLDEFASKLRGREWEPFQDTFVPQLLKKDHPDYAKYNVGSFGRQIESLIEGTTPTELVNPLFDDIINAGIEANFLNPLAARSGQKEFFYSFNRSYVEAVEYFQGNAPTHAYPQGGPSTGKALALRGTTVVSMPFRYIGAAATEGQKWLFDSIIPRAKYSAFLENMYQEIYRRPEIAGNNFLLRNAAADIAASIDNRFGMLNYDNLVMDKTMKDLMFLYWRAPAWKLGTKREILGGIRDVAYSASLKAQNVLERKGGVPKEMRRKNVAEIRLDDADNLELSQRASYLLGMFGLGAYAAFFQYARTGEFPNLLEWNEDQSAWNNFHDMMEKLWFPLSGDVELGAYGMEPIRLSMPTYNKDVVNWFRNYGLGFIETFPHALPPMWGPMKLLYSGHDYRKNSIYSADSDTIPEKAADFFLAAIKGQAPFSGQQAYERLTVDKAPIAVVAAETFLGLTKAGSGFIRSPAFEAAMDLMVADLPATSKPQYLSVYQEAQRKVAGRLRSGESLDQRKIARLFQKDLEEAGLVSTPEIITSLTQRTDATRLSMIDPVRASREMFDNMLRKARGYNQIQNVVKLMSPEEFTAYFGEKEHTRRQRKIQFAMRSFQGPQDHVKSALENLNETIDRKAANGYVVPGLLSLHKRTAEEIRSADISDKWTISLLAALRYRDGR